ncbi:MAG: exo-alpha-sialidase, partial [Planctomycetales bacterium]|nr:exo-alpha-sialidase [Planctomycetales bacterium]
MNLGHIISRVCLLMSALIVVVAGGQKVPADDSVHHVVVFGEDGKFAGWPANHGIWHWGNEILVGFSIGTHDDLGNERHNIARDKTEHHVLGRSLDGGETWQIEYPAERGMLINQGGMRHGITDPKLHEAPPEPISQPIDFANPNFCMTLRFQDVDGGKSRLYYSYDRGHDWQGPFAMPGFDQPGVMARTDYIIDGPHDCHVFLTVSKQNRTEGRVIATQMRNGGTDWRMLGYVGPEPVGFSIMSSTVRLNPTTLLMATRRRAREGRPKRPWLDLWKSPDNGKSWQELRNPVDDVGEGNPPALLKLRDGRLCLTYGVRKPPFSIEARFSS